MLLSFMATFCSKKFAVARTKRKVSHARSLVINVHQHKQSVMKEAGRPTMSVNLCHREASVDQSQADGRCAMKER